MLWTLLAIVCIAVLPWLLGRLVKKVRFLNALGLVFLCYAAGLLLSFLFSSVGVNMSPVSTLYSVFVMTAIPLILFSANLGALKTLAKPMLVSFGLNCAVVVAVTTAAFFLFRNAFSQSRMAADMAGMIIGGYTGGTPNSMAIGRAMNAGETIILFQTGDIITGGIYFLCLITILPRIAARFLKPYKPVGTVKIDGTEDYVEGFSLNKRTASGIAKAVLLALGCVVVAVGFVLLLPVQEGAGRMSNIDRYTAVIMLLVTTMGVALSFSKKVRHIPGSYAAGQYMILMFSVGMGMCFDLVTMKNLLPVILMELFCEFLVITLHIFFGRLCGIDRDTLIITSAAGVFSPAFVIPVARSMDNDEIVLPGILCGILGYAVGNYVGLGMGMLLLMLC